MSDKKNPDFLRSIINKLQTIKTDEELSILMISLVSITAEKIIDCGQNVCSRNIALVGITILKTYFEAVLKSKSNDVVIIAFNMAEQLEAIEKSYDVYHEKKKQQRASEKK